MPIPAIIAAIAYAAKWVFTATSGWAVAAKTAIMVAGSYFLNRALTPSIRSRTEPTSHPFGAQTTEEQGGPIQVVYGSTRAYANIVGHYLDIPAQAGVEKNSTISRHILACFGEGPWAAEPDETTLRLNGRPSSDFPDISLEWKLGLVDQAALTAWSALKQDYWVGQTCITDEPVTYTMTRTGFDEMSVILHWPKGLIHYGTEGDTHHEELTVKVEFGDAIADTWQTVYEAEIAGKTSQPAWKRIHASGSWTGGSPFNVTPTMQPRARVTLLTSVSTNSRHIRDVEFAAVRAEKNVGFTHPGMVLLDIGTVPNEVLSGGVTELSIETTGKVVQDEEGDFAVSRYHADAIRDILTQPVIEGDGDGDPWEVNYYRGVDDASLVGAGWAAQKSLADTQVPDGNGNNVDMLRFDAVFSSSTSVNNAIGQVGASGRCGFQCIGNGFGLWVDTPRTPVGILCDGNWERDSFQLDPIGADDLAGEASVRYRDGDAGFAERSVLVIDHDMDTLTTVDVDLIGTSRTHEAARLARRELARNRLVDLTAECRADIDAVVYEAGDVVYCQIDGRSIGGRVTAATATTIVVNRSVAEAITGDDVVIVQRRDAVTGIQELDLQAVVSVSADGKTITVAGWDTTPMGDGSESFLFGPAAMEDDDQFEIVESSLDQDLHVSLSLMRYVPALDDLDAVAPDAYVPLSALGRVDHYGGVTRRDLSSGSVDRIGTRGDVICEWGCYTFTANDPGAGQISWATQQDDDGDDSGYVRYGANLYQPADGDTANTYVYWDPDNPAVFSETDDFADVVGKFLVAVNDGGTPITGFAFIPVDATSPLWANITGVGKPADYADVTADSPIDTFRETFENPNDDFATRWTITGDYSIVAEAGVAGGRVFRAGNNSGDDRTNITYNTKIPYDPDKLYRMRIRARRTAGAGVVYAGLYTYDNAGAVVAAQPNGGTGHFICLSAEAVAADWTVYTGYFTGHSADGTAGECPNPAAPGALKTGSAYFVPRLFLNYPTGTSGVTDVDEIAIDIIPENADQIAESSTKKWAGESGADVTANHQDDINIDNIQDGSSYKKLSAANLAALQSAINVDTPQPRSGWEGAFTNNSPSAGYVAWSSFVIRYQGTDYTVAASNTASKYLYWNAGATKTQLYGTDTIGDALGTGKFIVGYNDSGTFYPAQFIKIIHGALIQAATILAEHLSVSQLSAIVADLGTVTAGTIILSLGGDNRLKISTSGIQGSDDGGSSWYNIITTDSGKVVIEGDVVKAGTIIADAVADDELTVFRSVNTATSVAFSTSSYATIQSRSFPASGGVVHLAIQVQLKTDSGSGDVVNWQILRGTTEIVSGTQAITNAWKTYAFSCIDLPSAATYTYYFKVQGVVAEGDAQNRIMYCEEAIK